MTRTARAPAAGQAANRLDAYRRMADMLRGLDHVQLSDGIPVALSRHLAAPRYRARLERRFARRTGLSSVFATLGEPILDAASLGEAGLRAVIVDTGVLCQYAALRRLVDQAVLADLSAQLGLDLTAHDARRATGGEVIDLARALACPEPGPSGDVETLIHAILDDGLRCWTCWVHARPPGSARFLEALVPALPGAGPVIASEPCKPRDCARRAALFQARLTKASEERGGT